jgi:hypothetical protein
MTHSFLKVSLTVVVAVSLAGFLVAAGPPGKSTAGATATTGTGAKKTTPDKTGTQKKDDVDKLFDLTPSKKLTTKQQDELDKLKKDKEQPLRDALKEKEAAKSSADKQSANKKFADLAKEFKDARSKILQEKPETTGKTSKTGTSSSTTSSSSTKTSKTGKT